MPFTFALRTNNWKVAVGLQQSFPEALIKHMHCQFTAKLSLTRLFSWKLPS